MSKASVYFTLNSINGKHNIKDIKKELDTLPGVMSVSISENSNNVAVDYDTTGIHSDRIEKQLKKIGCDIISSKSDDHIM